MGNSSTWLASHDRFSGGAVGVAYVYASDDLVEWENTANVTDLYWAQLFEHRGRAYLIGTTHGSSNITISRCLSSPCDGRQWSPATVLYANATYHCAPTPVVDGNDGYLYRAFDYATHSPKGQEAKAMGRKERPAALLSCAAVAPCGCPQAARQTANAA